MGVISFGFKQQPLAIRHRANGVNRCLVDAVTQNHPNHMNSISVFLTGDQLVEHDSARTYPSWSLSVSMTTFLASVDGVRQELAPDVDGFGHLEGPLRAV